MSTLEIGEFQHINYDLVLEFKLKKKLEIRQVQL